MAAAGSCCAMGGHRRSTVALSATADRVRWPCPAQQSQLCSNSSESRVPGEPRALLVGRVRTVSPAEAGVTSLCSSGAERGHTSEGFPREKNHRFNYVKQPPQTS